MDEPLDMNRLGKGKKGPWDTIKLIDKKTGELLLECSIGDRYHQLLLEVGLNTILKRVLSEHKFIPPDVSYDEFFEDEGGKE